MNFMSFKNGCKPVQRRTGRVNNLGGIFVHCKFLYISWKIDWFSKDVVRHSVILCTLYSGSRVHTEYTHIFNMECCSVTSCKKSPNLHRFPNDVHIRRQWTVFCCRASSWIPGPGDRICQLHFSSHDIKSDGRLKEEAVPHIKGIFKTYWIFASPFRMFCSGVDNFSPFTISNWKFIKHFLSPISQ